MATTAVATTDHDRPGGDIVKFREQLEQRAGELKMVLPSHISSEKFQRTVLTAAQQNPQLLTVDRRSLILACMKAAQDALLPDGREAAIVPFKENKKVDGQWQTRWAAVYMPMVYGLRKKILQSGEVISLEVNVVYRKEVEAGHFYYEVGRAPPLGHRPMLDLTIADTSDDKIVGAYSIATMRDGSKSYEFMRRFEIDKVRETSQTGATRDRQGKERKPSGPWVEWFPEQAKKTVVRRHSKTLPMSGDVIIDVEGRELENNMSTVALLDTQPGGEPQALEDHTEETPHDPETGEVIEAEAHVETAVERVSETAGTEPEPAVDHDQAGAEQHPAEAIVDQLAAAFGQASNIPTLKKLYDGAELDLAAMPDELAARTEGAYDQNLKRLGTTRAKLTAAMKRMEQPKPEPEQRSAALPEQTDSMGVVKDPAEDVADGLIASFAKAETIIDLKGLYSRGETDIAGMPDEIAAGVERSYSDNLDRLTKRNVAARAREDRIAAEESAQ